MAEKRQGKGWRPGGKPGKLHAELNIPKDEKIPAARLAAAERSDNPEIRRDAIRAKTMEGWHHGDRKKIYDHPRSRAHQS